MGLGDFVTSVKDKAVSGINAVADAVSESAPVKMATEALTTAKDAAVAVKDKAVELVTSVTPGVNLSKVTNFLPEGLKMAAKTVVQNIDVLALAAVSPVGAMGYAIAKSGTWKSADGNFTVTKIEGKGLGAGQNSDAVYTAMAEAVGSAPSTTAQEVGREGACDDGALTGQCAADGSITFTNVYDEVTGQQVDKTTGLPTEKTDTLKVSKQQWDYLNGKTDTADGAVQRTSSEAQTEQAFQDHKYTDEEGREVEVKAVNGQVTITRRGKNGKVEVEVKARKDLTTAEIGDVNATRDVKAGTSTIATSEGTLLQGPQGRSLTIGENEIRMIDGKAVWFKNGKQVGRLTDQSVVLEENNATGGSTEMLLPTADMQARVKQMQNDMANASDQALSVLVAPDMTIGITKRMRIEKMNNGHTLFRAKQQDADDKVFLLTGEGKLMILVDGKFQDADDTAKDCWKKFVKQIEDIRGLKVDEQTGNVSMQGFEAIGTTVTLGSPTDPKHQTQVTRDNKGTPTVTTPEATATPEGNGIAITPENGPKITWDGKVLETDRFKITADEMVDKKTGTAIKQNGDITTEDGKGPTLKAAGGVDFDSQTSIDASGNVRSGSWHASAGYDISARPGGTLEKATQARIQSATSDADSIRAKVSNKTVRLSDIGSLDAAYSSISGLIGTFANAGNSAMVAQLIHAMGRIDEVRGAAYAPAYAAQLAENKGITSPTEIANIQGRLLTDTPEHAVRVSLGLAA